MTVTTVQQRLGVRREEIRHEDRLRYAEKHQKLLRSLGKTHPGNTPGPELVSGQRAPKLKKSGTRKPAPITLAGPKWSHPGAKT